MVLVHFDKSISKVCINIYIFPWPKAILVAYALPSNPLFFY